MDRLDTVSGEPDSDVRRKRLNRYSSARSCHYTDLLVGYHGVVSDPVSPLDGVPYGINEHRPIQKSNGNRPVSAGYRIRLIGLSWKSIGK